MTTAPPDARTALAEIVAGLEPTAWMHPSAGWTNKSYDAVRAHCRNDGPMPEPLYSAEQVASLQSQHRMEIADMADHFRAVNVERVFAMMPPDMVELMARANAAQARIAALEAQVEGMRVALEMISAEAKEDNEPIGRSVFKALKTCGDVADIAIRAALQSSETTGEK